MERKPQMASLEIENIDLDSWNENGSKVSTGDWSDYLFNDLKDSSSIGIVSDEIYSVFSITFTIVLGGGIGIMGVVTNTINIVVLKRQGLTDSVNISLFGLAIADMCCVVTMIWSTGCAILIHTKPPPFVFDLRSLQLLTASYPRLIATRVTCWMTALISVERCLCVILPLKIKLLFTSRNVSAMVIGIFVTVISTYSLQIFTQQYFVLSFNPSLNMTQYVIYVRNITDTQNVLNSLLHTLLPVLNLLIIVICAIILTGKLKLLFQWRSKATLKTEKVTATSQKDPVRDPKDNFAPRSCISKTHNRTVSKEKSADKLQETSVSDRGNQFVSRSRSIKNKTLNRTMTKEKLQEISVSERGNQFVSKPCNNKTPSRTVTKEVKLTKMILSITTLFIICNGLSTILQTVSIFIPEYHSVGRYKNLFLVTNLLAFCMETVNSSVNLFVFYKMSSRFKSEVDLMFPCLSHK